MGFVGVGSKGGVIFSGFVERRDVALKGERIDRKRYEWGQCPLL